MKHKNAHFRRQVLHHSGLHVPTTVSSSRHHNKHESSRSMCAVVLITPVELHGRAHGRQRAVVNESLMRSWRTETPVCRGRGNSSMLFIPNLSHRCCSCCCCKKKIKIYTVLKKKERMAKAVKKSLWRSSGFISLLSERGDAGNTRDAPHSGCSIRAERSRLLRASSPPSGE